MRSSCVLEQVIFLLVMCPYSKIWKRPIVMLTTVDLKTVDLIIASMQKTSQDRMMSRWANIWVVQYVP